MSTRRRPVTDPRKAVAYIRVSTDEQTLGPEAQHAAIQRWAALRGAELVAVHRDIGVSGATDIEERKGFMAAMADLTSAAAGVLVVAKRDRLARDLAAVLAAEQLVKERGALILTADGDNGDDDDAAFLRRRFDDLFAEVERRKIRSRTRAALAVKKARGERTGQLPYGYALAADGVHLIPAPEEQAIIARIRAMADAGVSGRAILRVLVDEGTPARGARWHLPLVQKVIRERPA